MAVLFENYDCGNTGFVGRAYGLDRMGQTFKPQVNHSLIQVGMRLRKVGAPPGTYRVQIERTLGGLPTGVILAQADFASAPITGIAGGEMKLVVLDVPYPVVLDTEYGIALWPPLGGGGVMNCLQWYWKKDTNPYPRGEACYSINILPPVWVAATNYDFGFQEWGDPIAIPTVTTNPATEIS